MKNLKVNINHLKNIIHLLIENNRKIQNVERVDNSVVNLVRMAEILIVDFGDKFVTQEILLLSFTKINDQTKEILNKNNVNFKNLYDEIKKFRKDKKAMNETAESGFDTLNRYASNLTEKATKGFLDPVIGRDEEIRRVIQVLSRRTKNNPILIGEPGVGKTAIAEGLALRIAKKDVPEKLKAKQIFSLDLASILAGAKFRGDFEERLKSLLNEIEKQQDNIILFIDEIHSLVGAGGGDGSLDASNIFKPALARGELHCIGATTLDEYRKYVEKDKALERRFQQVYINEPDIDNSISMMRGIKEKYELFHGITISDKALLASVNLSFRYITDRYLPDKAIDLIDEAASRKRIEIDSKPDELDEIDRRIIQLQIEKKVLMQESDKSSKDKLLKVEEELNQLQFLSKNKTKNWNSSKKLIEEERLKKIELENARNELDIAKRNGNWDRAGEISYQIIPNLEMEIKQFSNKNNSINTIVNEEDVALVVSKWTGIPVEKMLEAERSKLIKIEDELKKAIVGQESVISQISKTIIRSRAGLNDSSSPIGSFLFLGSTGVGKTETAKTLAQFLFNDRNALIRIDMSEYMEKHSVSRLIGAPPGYVGYDEGGILTEAVRRRPYRVILFDEIEKANLEVLNILLQVMDDGRLTDSHGKIVDFTNTIIIMTSNIGAEHFNTDINFTNDDAKTKLAKQNIIMSVKSKLNPEFINRLDEILFFSKLGKSHITKIVEIQLFDLMHKLSQKNMKIEWNDEVITNIALMGYSPEYGARPIKRKIRSAIEDKISELIIKNDAKEGDTFLVEIEDGQTKVCVKK
ncbi:MAG: ATP-dependent Clp protease ATP-binding subunit [Candidatus Puniceispirillales bacterium]